MTDTNASDASAPQLKVHPEAASPAAQMIAAAAQEGVETDRRGRRLHFRKPGVLAEFRLAEALGPSLAANQTYYQMVAPLLWLGQIENPADPDQSRVVPQPQNKAQIEGLITELGEEGMETLLTWYFVNVSKPTMDAMEAAEAREAQKAALKNG